MKKSSLILLIIVVAYSLNAQTNVFPTTGNAGIGTTSPTASLSILKPIVNNQVGTLLMGGYAGTADNRSISFQQIGNASTAHQYFFLNGGLGSGSVVGSPVLTSVFAPSFGLEGNDNNLNVLTSSNGTNVAAYRAMSFTPGGDIGIGTTTPRSRVEQIGPTRFSASATSSSFFIESAGMNTLNDYSNVRLIASSALGSGYLVSKVDNWGGAFSWVRGGSSGDITVMIIDATAGNVGIGTTTPQEKLAVMNIICRKVKVTQTGWPDYVFHSAYSLRPLSEVEKFIGQNKHLPGVPSAAEVEKNGLDLGDNQAILLKKIEELTLYMIEQNKKQEELSRKVKQLRDENIELRKLIQRK